MKRRSFLQAALGAIGLGKLAGDEILDSLRSSADERLVVDEELYEHAEGLSRDKDFREVTMQTYMDSGEMFEWKNPQRR